MKRLLVLAALALSLSFPAASLSSPAPPNPGPVIYVTNTATTLSDDQVQAALPALQAAADYDFAPAWHVDPTLIFLPATDPSTLPAEAWSIQVSDLSDVGFGVLGYHDFIGGAPVAHVFAQTAQEWKSPWTITFSHELFEMLADPTVDRAVRGPKRWWLVEVGDPVQDDRLAYAVNGYKISDFVLPAWYHASSLPPYDFRHKTSHPFQILKGGSAAVWSDLYQNWTSA